ncbi:MAG: sulfoxide reductase catalytic subunit YedY [bacterium]|jgi:sulfoxide reductase catalytic subunit YedY
MLIQSKKDWELSESSVTDENTYWNRREVLKKMGLTLATAAIAPQFLFAAKSGFPTKLNSSFNLPKNSITKEKLATTYNNFYEFSTDKGAVHRLAEGYVTDPWTIEVSGLVQKPKKFDVEDLVKKIGIEQRIYRFRCVETWSMIVPWDGFSLKKLLALVQPLSSAKYVKFTSFFTPSNAPGQKSPYYSWPYTEGLTIQEAENDLTLLATGMYGKELPMQNGAPIRLMTPWKYGFKSIKSIVKIELTDKKPKTLWESLGPNEYGFYANVNPNVDHPRWSQKQEKPLGSWFTKQKTQLFNGYGSEVAHLYKGMDLTKFY